MNLHETYVVARAIVRVLRDSDRTEEIHRVEEITGRRRFGRFLAEVTHRGELEQLLRDRPELSSRHLDFAALRALPEDSLGSRYVQYLERYDLTADSQATGTVHVDDPDVSYFVRRFRQTHDVWHALLELGTQGHEEVIIHAFSYGQLRLPVSALVILFGTLKHIVLERRWRALRHALIEAYRIGRDAEPLLPVYWENLWTVPIDEVRRRYNVRPCTPEYVHG